MRAVNKTSEMARVTTMNVTVVSEEITVITENKVTESVLVSIISKDSDGNIVKTENYSITGEHYTLLMSESPTFAPGKPDNEYRERDLWYILDTYYGTSG